MTVLIKILQVIVSLGLLIILHEGGHYLFAKLFKTRVKKFYLFFDYKFHLFSTYDKWYRKLLGKAPVPKDDKGDYEYQGTEYGIGWIPLGGYVQIDGMIDETQNAEKLSADPQPWEFRTKPAWQRLLIMLGGILMNFIVAFFIYSMVLFAWGKEYVKSEDMTYGLKFSPSAKSLGFEDGDIIMTIDGDSVESWSPSCLRTLSTAHSACVVRSGQTVTIDLPGDLNFLEMLEQPLFADYRMPLVIDSIVPGSPASSIGLVKGDVITELNGKAISDFNDLSSSLQSLGKNLSDKEVLFLSDSLKARTVSLSILSGDSVRKVEAEIGRAHV